MDKTELSRSVRERILLMLRGVLLTASFLVAICNSSSGWATTVGFDDLDASAGDVDLSTLSAYQGFNWSNVSAYTSTPGFPGYNNGIVSAPNAAYSGGDDLGAPVIGSVSAASPFDFVSAILGSGWYDNLNVTLTGLLQGVPIATRTVTVDTGAAQAYTFSFAGIDQLQFSTSISAATTDPYGCGVSGCSQFTMDDLVFAAATTPVPPPPDNNTPTGMPEPSSFILLGIPVALWIGCRRTSEIREPV